MRGALEKKNETLSAGRWYELIWGNPHGPPKPCEAQSTGLAKWGTESHTGIGGLAVTVALFRPTVGHPEGSRQRSSVYAGVQQSVHTRRSLSHGAGRPARRTQLEWAAGSGERRHRSM